MPAFRLVPAPEAGNDAVGILIPPGKRTVLILRPRSLEWDLVVVTLTRSGPTTMFREFNREEAEAAADTLHSALEAWANGGPWEGHIVPAGEEGHFVRLQVGSVPLVVCRRLPGEPYRVMIWPSGPEAETALTAIRKVLCPGPDAEQPLYFNHRNFAR
jgi:hypothetical protein